MFRKELEQCVVSQEELDHLIIDAVKVGGIISDGVVFEFWLRNGETIVTNRSVGEPCRESAVPDSSEILKIAFGFGELLQKQFPELQFQVMNGLLVESGIEENSSACIINDRYQITITDNRIALTIASGKSVKTPVGVDRDLNMQYAASLDTPEQRLVFALPDPQAIDKIIQVIGEDVGRA